MKSSRPSNTEMMLRRNAYWRESVHRLLAQGFGVEDIAIRLDCAVERVRQEMAILRISGKLGAVLKGKQADPDE